MHLLVIAERDDAPEVLAAFHAVEVALLVALSMLVQQVLAREGLAADRARELVRVHMEHVVPRQVVQPGVFLGTNVAAELGPLRVTSLMVLQIPLLGEGLLTCAARDLIAVVLLRVHMTSQLVARCKLLLAEQAHEELLRLLVPLYALQEIRIGHDLVEERVLQFVLRLGGGARRDLVGAIGSILC